MNELIYAAFIGGVVGYCISKMKFSTKQGYWYSITFFDSEGFKNVVAQFENKVMRIVNIAAAKHEAKALDDAVLISVNYLGQDSVSGFTSNIEDLYKEIDKKEDDEK